MRRYASKERATPQWADRQAILDVYQEAYRLSNETGIDYQVDHIVPILSKLVCGLHVSANLRIIPKTENIAKGNRMWPGHPDPKCDLLLI